MKNFILRLLFQSIQSFVIFLLSKSDGKLPEQEALKEKAIEELKNLIKGVVLEALKEGQNK